MIEACQQWRSRHDLMTANKCALCGFGPCVFNLTTMKVTVMNYDKDYTETPSLQASDDASAAVQRTKNRITLDHIKSRVEGVEYINPPSIPHMTIAIVVLDNGYAVVGKSTPADAANFDETLGKQFAYEDALRAVWPLEAYLLREALSK
jgi:hypothetical protein